MDPNTSDVPRHAELARLKMLLDISTRISSEKNVDRLLQRIIEEATLALDSERSSLFRVEKSSGKLYSVIAQGLPGERIELKLGEGIAGSVADTGRLENIPDIEKDPRFRSQKEGDFRVRNMLCAPMHNTKGDILGVVQVMNKRSGAFDVNDEMLLTALASQAAVAIENAELYLNLMQLNQSLEDKIDERTRSLQAKNEELLRLNARLEELAVTDALTQCFNRRYFNEHIRQDCARSERYGDPLSLIILDIDHFKRINDSFGHLAGDQVLRDVAGILKGIVRSSDKLSRYGGEEFAVLMPNTGLAEACSMAVRLREAVEGHAITYDGKEIRATISLGVAEWLPEYGKAAERLTNAADQSLYNAKSEGRNRVCHFEKPVGVTG
ncbi:MAG: sensor domain-containing diguanylate cyclase [Gammaproteobacteria bacterium]